MDKQSNIFDECSHQWIFTRNDRVCIKCGMPYDEWLDDDSDEPTVVDVEPTLAEKFKPCNHEYVPMLFTWVCKHCGWERPDDA